MNMREIKDKAKDMVNGNIWNIWKPILIYGLIIFATTTIINLLFIDDPNSSSIIKFIVSIILIPGTYGITAYNLNLVRGNKFSLNNLTEYYPSFIKLLLISLLTGLFVILWSFLFIIPAIIAIFSYSMISFVIIDNTELTALEVIRKSKELMRGHKFEYFVLNLSFIGWDILSMFTLGLLNIWLIPYKTITTVLFYENLIANSLNNDL